MNDVKDEVIGEAYFFTEKGKLTHIFVSTDERVVRIPDEVIKEMESHLKEAENVLAEWIDFGELKA